ncbi:MAG: CPBP family intramembrane metalloprotease [Anaerolineae bacterium]|jgi:membrane protease YdiL (CAAX protease family)
MRRSFLLALIVYAVQVPITAARATGVLPVHPIVFMLPLVGVLNGQVEGRRLGGLGLTVWQPIRSILLALAFTLLGFAGRLLALHISRVPLRLPPITPASIGSLASDLAIDLFIIALWEEIVNRGYIQTRLQSVWGFWGVIASAILFASLHLPGAVLAYAGRPLQVLFRCIQTGLAGLTLGYLYWWTGSVVPTIALHGLRNFSMLSLVQHLSAVPATRLFTLQMPLQLLWLLGEAGLMVAACRLFLPRRRCSS